MGQMIKRVKELIRINPVDRNKIEYSTNDGRTWTTRCSSSYYGGFSDLVDNGKEILGTTARGLYYSMDEGRTWNKK